MHELSEADFNSITEILMVHNELELEGNDSDYESMPALTFRWPETGEA